MDVIRPNTVLKKIRLVLVFFCLILITFACQDKSDIEDLNIVHEDGRAIGVTFSTVMNVENLRFFIGEESQTSVLGVIVSLDGSHTFSPAVPFTPGQTYSIRNGDIEVVKTFTVPEGSNLSHPHVKTIYPTRDTVPENLLKMYVLFSEPMQQVGNAMDYIRVTDDSTQREVSVFLKLESELWNADQTRLTLWLDPGRIKTDLIPNKEQGLPLLRGHSYTLRISDEWKSAQGKPLDSVFFKKFYVGKRDVQKPRPSRWKFKYPRAGTKTPLHIDFGETLDAILVLETVNIVNQDGHSVEGHFELEKNENGIVFLPEKNWIKGIYKIKIKSILEDLAGNNVNRLFDTDISNSVNTESFSVEQEVLFPIQ